MVPKLYISLTRRKPIPLIKIVSLKSPSAHRVSPRFFGNFVPIPTGCHVWKMCSTYSIKTHYFTNSARNDRRTCSNRENWNSCTPYLYDLLCNCILWAKCRNLGKSQIGPMAIQTNLGFWKLHGKCIHTVCCWSYEPCFKWNYFADNMQYQHL